VITSFSEIKFRRKFGHLLFFKAVDWMLRREKIKPVLFARIIYGERNSTGHDFRSAKNTKNKDVLERQYYKVDN